MATPSKLSYALQMLDHKIGDGIRESELNPAERKLLRYGERIGRYTLSPLRSGDFVVNRGRK